MRCPHCWSERTHVRHVGMGKRILLGLCLLTPVRCEHCYHKFVVPWFSTIGRHVERPAQRQATHVHPPTHPSLAATRRTAHSASHGPAAPPAPQRPRPRPAA
jgi:hypothetical protein